MFAACLTLIFGFQSPDPSIIENANSVFAKAEAYAGKAKSKKMFMLRGNKTWLPMRNESDHLDSGGGWSMNTTRVAFVYVREGRTILVSLTDASPSGDWQTTTTCAYRTDGSLAKAEQRYSALSPFEGVAIRHWIYSTSGVVVQSGTLCTDLSGKFQMYGEKQKNLLDAASSFLFEPKDYLKVGTLPFAKLLASK